MNDLQRSASRFAIARLVALSFGLIGSLFVARTLGLDRYGYYATGAALVPIVMAVGLGGIDQLYLRGDLARQELPSLLRRWALLLGSAGLVVAFAIPGLTPTSRTVAILLTTAACFEVSRSWWLLEPQREGRLDVRANRELYIRGATLATVVLAVLIYPTAVAAAAAPAIAGTLVLLFLSSSLRSDKRVAERTHFATVLRSGLGYSASGTAFSLYMGIPTFSVAIFATSNQAGAFRAAYVLYAMLATIPVALNNEAMRPLLYRLALDPSASREVQRRFRRTNVAAGFIATATGLFCASICLAPLLGASFRPAIMPAMLLCLGLPFHFANSFMGNVLVARGALRAVVRIQGLGVVASLVACPLMAAAKGASGAAIALVAVEVLLGAVYFMRGQQSVVRENS